MVRIFILVLVSVCFTTLSIYANCDLPTGGACSIKELKEKQKIQRENPQTSTIDKLMEKMGDDARKEENSLIQKDLNNQVNLEKLYNLEFED